ncbi:MAG: YbfB/YjiJ family MFS transporter [Methylophilus sp.]|nr:YbfB/YjiJ family MFS transporter [Methylophilus sp.]
MTSQISRFKVLFAGICSLILSMGIARFAYTPLLPVMMSQAGLSHADGGWLAAINYAGYLLGVILASLVSDAVLKDRLYRWGMVLAVLTTAMMGLSTDFYLWAVSRFVAGLCTAAGLMLGSGLILNWLFRHDHKRELGIHFSGIGMGIVVCSLATIAMKHSVAWDMQWTVLTGIACALLVPALMWFPAVVKDEVAINQKAEMQHAPPNARFMRLFLAAYCCAGFGYVITATFIVAIVNAIPALANQGGWVFLVIGLVAAPSSYVWDMVARKVGDVNALCLAGLIEVVGIVMPTLGLGLAGALISAVLYGATAIAIVSLVLTMAGRYYPAQPAKMMSKMTICYGVAQIVGPSITGWLAQTYGGYEVGLYLAAGIMLVGSILFYLMRNAEDA